MPIVTPNLHFQGQCKDAIQLYIDALGGVLLSSFFYGDAEEGFPPEQRDWVYHAELLIGEQRLMFSDWNRPTPPPGNTVSLVLTYDTPQEVEAAFEGLSPGCTLVTPMHSTPYSSCFVSLVDRFGMRWELMTEQADQK